MTTVPHSAPAPGISYFTPHQEKPAGTAVVPQPDGKPIPTLFKPLKIRGVEFQNRIFLSPLCQYSAENGFATAWHMAHLGGIISRGPGLALTEAAAVVPEGRIAGDDLGIWSDAHIEPLAKIVEFAHSQSQKIGIQLAHAGQKASILPAWISPTGLAAAAGPVQRGWPDNVWAPTTKPYSPTNCIPKALTIEGIKRIVDAHRDAAIRSVKAGFDVVELTAAHGYILSSFMSPSSNTRTDEYGGSFENRIKFLLETVDAIRSVIPQTMPLFVRISGTEWMEEVAPNEPQWRVEDSARLALILVEHGVDVIDVSAGGINTRQQVPRGEAYQAPYAAVVKQAVGDTAHVASVGGLGSGPLAQRLLDNGTADIIFCGRGFQKNPGLVWAMADELGVEIHNANQIEWGWRGRGKRVQQQVTTTKQEL
ncbi:hypothetical protein AGABI2DRAFT_194309 [Agaricus bisporus var. bisporus H97]|uniref:hypothetical protein n=1 Tax=Agaricus bisporus var. bisporus (strain H97 / ATCC MYA-4626 / FGSC 10389) TaxID=936046 RepID=UPI00029F7B17|nr:hypothetical protein AGABI2DRAFT_194309 [Agaricus bisporus var. bisporus H97]EKV45360.1 hypothetical protein AGABI2DRAFT_194309 [Agaricus bisporus var. bisporus H97]